MVYPVARDGTEQLQKIPAVVRVDTEGAIMKSRKLVALLGRPRAYVTGATAVEYGVIAAAVCAVLAAVIFVFGQDIAHTFSALRNVITAAN